MWSPTALRRILTGQVTQGEADEGTAHNMKHTKKTQITWCRWSRSCSWRHREPRSVCQGTGSSPRQAMVATQLKTQGAAVSPPRDWVITMSGHGGPLQDCSWRHREPRSVRQWTGSSLCQAMVAHLLQDWRPHQTCCLLHCLNWVHSPVWAHNLLRCYTMTVCCAHMEERDTDSHTYMYMRARARTHTHTEKGGWGVGTDRLWC